MRFDLNGDPTFVEVVRRTRQSGTRRVQISGSTVSVHCRFPQSEGGVPEPGHVLSRHRMAAEAQAPGPDFRGMGGPHGDCGFRPLRVIVVGWRGATGGVRVQDGTVRRGHNRPDDRRLSGIAGDARRETRDGDIGRCRPEPNPTPRCARSGRSGAVQLPVRPNSPTQCRIVKEWEDILGIHPISVDDDLLELGASSLAVARLCSDSSGCSRSDCR